MRNTAQIDKVLADAVAGGRIAGLTAAAADQDGSFYTAAFGLRAIDTPKRMTTDTVFRIASMTKAITGAAAMQMVEQGKLSLDQPAKEILPFLAETQVLDGFDSAGKPILRAPKGEITLRNLLTHTAGFVYDTWNADMNRYAQQTGLPAARTGKLDALKAPLGFDPGDAVGIRHQHRHRRPDGRGRQRPRPRNLPAAPRLRPARHDRHRASSSARNGRAGWPRSMPARPDGTLKPLNLPPAGQAAEFFPGGGGLYLDRDRLPDVPARADGWRRTGRATGS